MDVMAPNVRPKDIDTTVKVKVMIGTSPLLNELGKHSKYCHGFFCKSAFDKCIFCSPVRKSIKFFCFAAGKKFVDFSDQY